LFAALLVQTSGRSWAVAALARVINVQRRCETEASQWILVLQRDRALALEMISRCRAQLCHLEEIGFLAPNAIQDLESASLELLAVAHAKDGAFFRDHQDEFLACHRGEYVAIRDGVVLGFARSEHDLDQLIRRAASQDQRVFIERIVPESFCEEDDNA
jgi:hypothetical protein